MHGCVTLFRPFLQRLEHDGVEIAAQFPAARALGATPLGARRVGLQDGVFQRAAGIALQACTAAGRTAVRTASTPSEYTSEAMVSGSPRNLLRRSVVGRQRASRQLGEPRLARFTVLEQLGDAEVQQPHLAVGADEDVCRLEVAVHDELAMCVRHGVGDLREQPQARPHVELSAHRQYTSMRRPSTYSMAR